MEPMYRTKKKEVLRENESNTFALVNRNQESSSVAGLARESFLRLLQSRRSTTRQITELRRESSSQSISFPSDKYVKAIILTPNLIHFASP